MTASDRKTARSAEATARTRRRPKRKVVQVITLSVRDSRAVLDALRDPGLPPAKLVEAARRYRAFVGEE